MSDKRQGLRAAQIIGLADGPRFAQRPCECSGDGLHGDGLKSGARAAQQRHDRRPANDSRKQVNKLILRPVNERGPEDRELQSAMPNQLLGGPFALVIARGRVGPGAQRAHLDKSPDSGLLRRGYHVPRALGVHVLIGALANLADYAHEMNHGLRPLQRGVQRRRLQHVAGMNLGCPA